MAGIGCGCGKPLIDRTCPLHGPVVEERMGLAEAMLRGIPDYFRGGGYRERDGRPPREDDMSDGNGHEDHVLKVPAGALGSPEDLERAMMEAGERVLADGLRDVLEHCEVLKAQPGDAIVFRPSEERTDDQVMWAATVLGEIFPRNRVVVLMPGDTLGAVRIGERE